MQGRCKILLAMVLWSRLSQGRVWDKLTHWLQDQYLQDPQEPAGPSALSYQRAILGVEPLQWLFEQGTHVLCTPETEGAWYRGHRLMALDGSLFNVADTAANAPALMYRSALQAELDPDRLSFTEAVFQLCEAVADERGEHEPAVQQRQTERLLQRMRRQLLPERHLRINRRELKQV